DVPELVQAGLDENTPQGGRLRGIRIDASCTYVNRVQVDLDVAADPVPAAHRRTAPYGMHVEDDRDVERLWDDLVEQPAKRGRREVIVVVDDHRRLLRPGVPLKVLFERAR